MTISEYLSEWNSKEGQKPCNEPEFVRLFIEWLASIDDSRDIQFEGDGSYFGQQVSISKDATYRMRDLEWFEIAYCPTIISVYRGNNEGYWVPEYIKIDSTHPLFNEVKAALGACLIKNMGLEMFINK